jgi:hypothetical protein
MLLVSVCSGAVGLTGALIAARRPGVTPAGEALPASEPEADRAA